jgi:hypothetical protein
MDEKIADALNEAYEKGYVAGKRYTLNVIFKMSSVMSYEHLMKILEKKLTE